MSIQYVFPINLLSRHQVPTNPTLVYSSIWPHTNIGFLTTANSELSYQDEQTTCKSHLMRYLFWLRERYITPKIREANSIICLLPQWFSERLIHWQKAELASVTPCKAIKWIPLYYARQCSVDQNPFGENMYTHGEYIYTYTLTRTHHTLADDWMFCLSRSEYSHFDSDGLSVQARSIGLVLLISLCLQFILPTGVRQLRINHFSCLQAFCRRVQLWAFCRLLLQARINSFMQSGYKFWIQRNDDVWEHSSHSNLMTK